MGNSPSSRTFPDGWFIPLKKLRKLDAAKVQTAAPAGDLAGAAPAKACGYQK
jgi:hypothetical protein